MTTHRNKYLLLNYIVLACLALLLLNDHLFKWEFSNWLTGKLSDAAGIILLPLLLAYLFPAIRYHSIWISAVFFIFWKSPFSSGLIEVYNQVTPIQITRVVDYSDLFVLLLLPIPFYIMRHIDRLKAITISRVHPVFVLIPLMVGFMATQPPRYYRYVRTDSNLTCYNCYVTLRYSQDEIVQKLQDDQLAFDSIKPFLIHPYYDKETTDPNLKLYRINQLVLDGDTLRNLDFTMRTMKEGKTRVYFTGMNVNADLSDWKLQRKLRKLYRKKVFQELRKATED
ncbi:MAG: hypothetical protein J7621_14040 [Niastella sp.]|nr:hypothetical protein [Niastella sp.]